MDVILLKFGHDHVKVHLRGAITDLLTHSPLATCSAAAARKAAVWDASTGCKTFLLAH